MSVVRLTQTARTDPADPDGITIIRVLHHARDIQAIDFRVH